MLSFYRSRESTCCLTPYQEDRGCFSRLLRQTAADLKAYSKPRGPHGTEHKPGTKGNNESAIKQHAETTAHDIHPKYAEFLQRDMNNRQKRLILESLHSTVNTDAVNERGQPFRQPFLPFWPLHPSGIVKSLRNVLE